MVTLGLRNRLLLVVGIAAFAAGLLVIAPPIPQPQSYHNFADQRGWLGVPNFLNVASNLPFLFVGLWGIAVVMRRDREHFRDLFERWFWLLLFLGVTLTCFGSSYYHWHPSNATLFWDRLPMTIGFMALFAAMLYERVDARVGKAALIPLVLLGAASVVQWHLSEAAGAGDLRFYMMVQFFPLINVPIMLWLFPPMYDRGRDIVVAILIYGGAKVFEAADGILYDLGGVVSGHSLKHVVAAVGIGVVVRMLEKRVRHGEAAAAA